MKMKGVLGGRKLQTNKQKDIMFFFRRSEYAALLINTRQVQAYVLLSDSGWNINDCMSILLDPWNI